MSSRDSRSAPTAGSPEFTVTRARQSGVETVRLAGRVDARADFAGQVGALDAALPVVFNCREITYIDSQGSKAWMDYFTGLRQSGVRFQFAECPPPVIEQMNYLARFACGARVLSVSVTFVCSGCGSEFQGVTRTENLGKIFYRLPPIKCPKCGSKATFQETPEEYFAFLIRQDRAGGRADESEA